MMKHMKIKRKWISGVLLLLLLVCGGCGKEEESYSYFSIADSKVESEASPEKTIILTHSQEEDNPVHEMAVEFKNQLETLTEGRYEVKIYPANSYGRIAGGYNAVCDGSIEMRIGGTSGVCADIISWLPAFYDIALEDLSEGLQVGGELYEGMKQECQKDDIYLLSILNPTYRVLSSNQKIDSIEDFVGLQIRIVEYESDRLYWDALATEPCVGYDIDTLYTALQMGFVAAQENPIEVIYSRKFYEHQDYLIKTNHRIQMNTLVVNHGFWDSLSPEDQEFFQEAAIAAQSRCAESAKEKNVAYEEVLAEHMTIVELPEAEMEKMRQTAGASIRNLLEETYGEDAVAEIIQTIE